MTGAGRRGKRADTAAGGESAAPATKTFAAPAWLTRKDARNVWARVVPELARFNIMTEVFRDVVGRYCIHFADWVKVSREIEKTGTTMLVKMTHSDERMPRINPAIRVRDTIERALVDLEDRFGLTPLARYRIVAHQAANPGQRDLFRDPQPDSRVEAAAGVPPAPGRSSPVGALLQ